MAELSKAGSLADLEAALEDEIIPKPFLLVLWDLEASAPLRVVQVVSEVASEEDLMADGDEEASEEASKIVEDTEEAEEV